MGAFDNVMLRLDQGVTGALGEWNSYSTALATLLVLVVSYSLFTRREPDTHPMLLARQSLASAVRHERESAVYRSHGAPHGMGLVTGLNVRAPGESRWSRGRDGDLRDIWRRAVEGAPDDDGAGKGSRPKGKLLTVLGREQVIEESFGMLLLPCFWVS